MNSVNIATNPAYISIAQKMGNSTEDDIVNIYFGIAYGFFGI